MAEVRFGETQLGQGQEGVGLVQQPHDVMGAVTDVAGISEEKGGAACPDDAACTEESPSKDGSTCGKDAACDSAAGVLCDDALAGRAETADVSVSNMTDAPIGQLGMTGVHTA